MNTNQTSKIFLWICGLFVSAIGLGALIAPDLLAAPLGFALDNPAARNEFRANYGGMLGLLGLLVISGARRDDRREPALYLVLCFAGGLVLGRLVSLPIDGDPGPGLYLFGALELATAAIAAILLRCRHVQADA